MKKDESFLGKLGGTLARKKKTREVTDLQEEGKSAINSPMAPALVDIHPEDTQLEENEERTMIDPTSRDDPKFKELVKGEASELSVPFGPCPQGLTQSSEILSCLGEISTTVHTLSYTWVTANEGI
ncbi:hypothetical protein STEG23_034642, partial [Scotinomys teguina]